MRHLPYFAVDTADCGNLRVSRTDFRDEPTACCHAAAGRADCQILLMPICSGSMRSCKSGRETLYEQPKSSTSLVHSPRTTRQTMWLDQDGQPPTNQKSGMLQHPLCARQVGHEMFLLLALLTTNRSGSFLYREYQKDQVSCCVIGRIAILISSLSQINPNKPGFD